MIAADEFGRIAAFRRDHERAAMGALIVDDVDTLVPIADQHDRLAFDPGGEIVPGMFHLGLVPDRDQAAPKIDSSSSSNIVGSV
jgi:hypothetical protein